VAYLALGVRGGGLSLGLGGGGMVAGGAEAWCLRKWDWSE